MNFNEYQKKAMSFRLPTANEAYVLLGLVGELGELYGYLAKAIRDGYEIDKNYVKKELGDKLWFMAAIAEGLGLTLDEVAQGNIDKLSGRQYRNTIKGSGDDR